jgi:hypothetical protein
MRQLYIQNAKQQALQIKSRYNNGFIQVTEASDY